MCPKDCKKLGISAFAAFVVMNILEFILHGKLLAAVYMRPHYASLWNPEAVMASRRGAMLLALASFSAAFSWIYAQGYEEGKSPLVQGLRFGLLAALLTAVPGALMDYMVYPVSCKLALAWAGGETVVCLALGAVVGSIYRPKPGA